MSVVTIQDFSGMMPLRDGILLPDRNAQYAKNTWLYKGSVRGFRLAIPVYTTIHSDTKQIYRIPESVAEPPNFSTSLWLEFPDPFMAVIRNPVVGDQFNRYYFFPSDQYNSTGANPDWPIIRPPPQYRTYDPTTNTVGPLLTLGIPTPIGPPTVVPAGTQAIYTTNATTLPGDTVLNFADTTGVNIGMSITDNTDHTIVHITTAAVSPGSVPLSYQTVATTDPTSSGNISVTHQTSAAAASGTTVLAMQDVTGVVIGMLVTNESDITRIASGTVVSSIAGLNVTVSQPFAAPIVLDDFINFDQLAANVLHLSNAGGIAAGMPVINVTNPSSIPSTTVNFVGSGDHENKITLNNNVTSIVHIGDQIQCGNVTSNVLSLNDVTGVVAGMTVTDTTNAAALIIDTMVVSVSGLNVTINQAVASSGVAIGDSIKFTNDPFQTSTTVKAVDATTVTLSAPTIGAGVFAGDEIQFDTTDIEVRSYVYTYVSAYGEEGPASQPATATGDPTGTWIITIPAPDPSVLVGTNLAKIRLYRTVVDSSGNAAYYQVTEFGPPFPTGITTYSDSALPQDVVFNSPLTSELFTGPPADLQGVVMMANGIAAGWSGDRYIYFSAAYLPHAWPVSYAVTVDYPVVGLTANGASLNILCKGAPFIATGVTPDTMTIGKISSNEPCISRGSIVSSGEGAYYASPNGVILLNASGTLSITESLYEKEFHNNLQPWNWAAGHYGMAYVAFIKGTGLTGIDPDGLVLSGLLIDRQDKNASFCYFNFSSTVKNMYFDEISGQLFELLGNGKVIQWNPPVSASGITTLEDWTWRSKTFRAAFPTSFKAIKIIFDVPPEITITPGVRNIAQNQVYDPTKQYLIIRVFADGHFVMVKEVQRSEEVLLIPDGFKAVLWELELQGQVNVTHLKMATSVKELRKA